MASVLLIDDFPAVLAAIREQLKSAGHDVTTATTGDQGVRRAREGRFDLIITDLSLPDRAVGAIVRELRTVAASGTPILAISAGGHLGALESPAAAMRLGADGLLMKPFDRATLLNAIAALIRVPVRP